MPPPPPANHRASRLAAGLLVLLAGVGLFAWALLADVRWLERHVMQSYLTPRSSYAWKLTLWRAVAAGLAVLLLLRVLPRAERWAAGRSPGALLGLLCRACAALLLLVLVLEGMLRIVDLRVQRLRRENPPLELRLGRLDARYGWVLEPSRTHVVAHGHGPISYIVNADGNRALSEQERLDPAAPTVVFVGESVVYGHGLPYEQTFAALVGKDLGVQVVNLAVGGYAVDQAYLRLADELPRLARPLAVVTLLLPALLDRTVRDFRPHLVLGPRGELLLLPPAAGLLQTLRLRRFLRNTVPYHSDAVIAEEIGLVGAIFSATAAQARSSGAAPIFFMPSPGPERPLDEHPEAWIVRELFQRRGLGCLVIDIDPAWTLPGDGHPGPRAARKLADALKRAILQEVPALGRASGR